MTGHESERIYCAAGQVRPPGFELTDLVSAMIGRRIRDLRIEVHRGGLVIRGRATSFHVKQLALHTVMTVSDLPVSANEIVVTKD
jgi:hypothetical protein